MSWVAVDKFRVVGKKISKIDNVFLQQLINPRPLLKYWYFGSFRCDNVPIVPNETPAIINTQPSTIQGEH